MLIRLRQAKIDDIEHVLAIEDSSFDAGIKESPQVFKERIAVFPEGFFLAETEACKNPVGYICSELWPSGRELTYQTFSLGHSIRKVHSCEGTELYISSMGVLPDYRGRGYGGQMLQQLIASSKATYPQVASVVLIVSEKWTAAKKTYLKLGFEQIGLVPAFFRPQGFQSEQGIVMRLIVDLRLSKS